MAKEGHKYIFVLGGVMSGVGKGIVASSTGLLLQQKGYPVNLVKVDPYLNVDAGTMNPTEHGEVFVLDSGLETDQDMGNYERFLGEELKKDKIAVILPMSSAKDKKTYNVNADDVASEIAVTLKAEKFVLLTNVRGIMRDKDDPSTLYNTLTVGEVNKLIKNKVIASGMIPKAMSCVNAIKGHVKKAHILDAGIPHALLLEMFTDKGIGTEIVK